MDRLFLVCALISLFCRFANARSGGAPQETCKTMAPNAQSHGEPQETDPPCMIQVDKAYYNESSNITVTVKANMSATIRGILIQAREVGKDKALGRFTKIPSMTKHLDCKSFGAENERGAVTHSQSLGAATMLTFQWEPTSMTTGDIYFMATIVQSQNTYWLEAKSDKLQDMTTGMVSGTTPNNTSSTPTGAMKTTPKDNGAISNAAANIALLILVISAKLFI